jgi:3-deoxy-D-manno-octulosonic-acid transferase
MIWKIYNILFILIFPLLLPRFLQRMRRRGGYAKDFTQRLGRFSPEVLARLGGQPRVWVHAVSVGELYVALELMKAWRAREPGVRFALTTTTSTAYKIAREKLAREDVGLYFPVDFPPVLDRVFNVINPRMLVLVEVELWPNVIRMARARGLPVFLVNARMSDRSYLNYLRARFLTRRLLPEFTLIAAQSGEDVRRFVNLGADSARVIDAGSAKYDVALATPSGEAEKARAVMRAAGITEDHLVLLGGSTWPGEEEAMVDLYRGLKTKYRNIVLLLAPRHVERTPEVVSILKPRVAKLIQRSTINVAATPAESAPDILLLDTTGELKNFYACADVIFIGKSLEAHGGQNIIEPALYGKPVLVGPNMENFPAIMEDFRAAGAVLQVKDLQGLRRAVDDLLGDPERRAAMGAAARRVVEKKSGTLRAVLDQLPVADDVTA